MTSSERLHRMASKAIECKRKRKAIEGNGAVIRAGRNTREAQPAGYVEIFPAKIIKRI